MTGFLIIEVNGRVHSKPSRLGDRDVVHGVEKFAEKCGYEIMVAGHRKSFAERAIWPLTLRAYTSPNREGRGRAGSQMYSYPARYVRCKCYSGRGVHSMTKCKRCKGTGNKAGVL